MRYFRNIFEDYFALFQFENLSYPISETLIVRTKILNLFIVFFGSGFR